MNYIDFENIDLYPLYAESLDNPDAPAIYVDLMKSGNGLVEGSYNSGNKTDSAYDDLCEKHGDTTFDREARIAPHDLITVAYNTARPYIDSGYTEYDKEEGMVKYSTITKNLADISSDDLTLVGDGYTRGGLFRIASLIFESRSTLSETHKITVTMTADDGRVFSDKSK